MWENMSIYTLKNLYLICLFSSDLNNTSANVLINILLNIILSMSLDVEMELQDHRACTFAIS